MSKRYLTQEEINDITSMVTFNKSIPYDAAVSIYEKAKSKIEKQLKNIQIYPSLIPDLKKNLTTEYYKSRISPGESVGIIAAQSIGEKQTQNSVAYDECTYIRYKDGIIKKVCIGEFIDDCMNTEISIFLDQGEVCKAPEGIQILAISERGKAIWSPITELSRHAPKGDLIKVETKEGKTATCTLGHSFLIGSGAGIKVAKGAHLKMSDFIPCIGISNVYSTDNYIDNNTSEIYICNAKFEKIRKMEIITESEYKYPYVYDFSVAKHNTFMLSSGIFVHNTLNSVVWDEQILINANGETHVIPIGKLIDDLLYNGKYQIQHIPENRTEYLDTMNKDMHIQAVDENGFIDWYKIEAITRHLPLGKLVKIKTKSGREMTATQSKSFLVYNIKTEKIEGTLGSDIKVGDLVPVTKINTIMNPTQSYQGVKLGKDIGFFMGMFINTGYIHDKEITIRLPFNNVNVFFKMIIWLDYYKKNYTHDDKNNCFCLKITDPMLSRLVLGVSSILKHRNIPDWVYTTNNNFIHGFIDGFISTSEGKISYKQNTLILSLLNRQICMSVAYILGFIGVLPDIKDNCLFINNNEFKKLFSDVDFTIDLFDKVNNVNTIPECDVVYDPVISVEYVESEHEYVYDLTVATTRNFQLFNGINCADTFHKAGQSEKSVTVGVPRFMELLNATKTPKMVNCKLYFKEHNREISELRSHIGSQLVCLTMKDLILKRDIILNKEPEPWYDIFNMLYRNDDSPTYEHCISLKLNLNLLYKYRITLQQIAKAIHDNYDDIYCIYSPMDTNQFDVFIDTSDIKLSEQQLLFVTDENKEEIYLEECVYPILEKLVVCGIPGISSMYFTVDKGEWYVETDGSNFKKLLSLDIIDHNRILSNNVWDIYNSLGIEAAIEFLQREFLEIMESVNICHIKILVERMTFNGTISSISRYTLKKDESGPLSKSSFEETTENFIRSAFSGDVERTRGVSASIICGKRANIGTGMFGLKNDLSKIFD